MMGDESNPAEPSQSLKRPSQQVEEGQPAQPIFPEDSALTKAEKIERNGSNVLHADHEEAGDGAEPPSKRVKVQAEAFEVRESNDRRDKVKGIALVKPEFLIHSAGRTSMTTANPVEYDDAAEARPRDDRDNNNGSKRNKKAKGQNTARQFGSSKDAIMLCNSRAYYPEFSPKECRFGDRCNMGHDLRKYLKEGKREDLTTLGGKCPVWEANGGCHAGWKCRFVGSHMQEVEREDGRKELILTVDSNRAATGELDDNEHRAGVHNVVSTEEKLSLSKRKTKTDKADQYSDWLEKESKETDRIYHKTPKEEREENRAKYKDPPFMPSEKRRLYFGPETPILAPLTTQGNMPFRRLCVELGAQLTYSEMALTVPLIQGQKSEWALMKAHESEISPPRFNPKDESVVQGYDNAKDLKFGAQVSSSKPWQALKAAEVMSNMLPHLRLIDLNCGCPIELVYRTGAGSALLDSPSKLEKMIRGMNTVSGDIPITAKIRMGTKDSKPTASKLIERLAFGGAEWGDRLGPPGCAAVTLHGRSRQQRYTRSADWSYIAECAAQIKSYNKKKDDLTDTVQEADARHLSNGERLYFIGNGDCYSHVDYYDHMDNAGVDSVMIARGALIKPWIFEEIEKGQYIDKTASQRLDYVEKFARFGLQAWGSDEMGLGLTRRFLLEWLSFAHRYVPIGILDHLPPSLQDRPPAYRGRNDLETLLSSDNYKDWIKISEMFLGPAHKDFQFQPKHKSNSYEMEAEG
ncbi:MAG: tRNA-dihydrouridine synthase 3 [Claussenomyces sp. TS43310]|nr:MAG: tRNA-dihydrouridine synthase 3 [Claussenomyces sp. TS43310]